MALILMLGDARCMAEEGVTSDTSPVERPRYKFEVGQELVYEVTGDERLLDASDDDTTDKKPIKRQSKWWVWITRKNDDGGWRLVIRMHVKLLKISPNEEPWVRFESDFLGYCDFAPDGSFAPNPTLGTVPLLAISPEALFIRFPTAQSASRPGWEYKSAIDDSQYRFSLAGNDGDNLHFAGSVEHGYDASYEMHRSRQVDFDQRRGLVTRIVDEAKGNWQRNPENWRMTVELTSVNRRDPAWIASLDADSERYWPIRKRYGELLLHASRERTSAGCAVLLDKARLLLSAMEPIGHSEVRLVIDASLIEHNRMAEEVFLPLAAAREKQYAQPPLDWETTDFADRSYRLVDDRGKVVVMYFWYRACGHCILALPKIKELAARYPSDKVALLGINSDQDDEDAQHVISAYELRYPNLRGREITRQYGVKAFPTFIVLDQTGRIAHYADGNTEDLLDHLTAIVDELLANPVTADGPLAAPAGDGSGAGD
ncbi:MAG: TlpA disulfide reductase family protein [Pirellulales bacterium]